MSKALELAKQLVEELQTLEDEIAERDAKIVSKTKLSDLNPGDIFKTEKRKYMVLSQDPLAYATKIISLDFVLENEKFDDNGNDYKNSQLKKKCDTEILEDFESEFGAENLVEHEVDLTTVDNQKCFGTVNCKVRPLTFDEARKYNDILVRPELPDRYWTCAAWSTADRGWPRTIAVVCPSGDIGRIDCNSNDGVRPVCILNSNILVKKVEE